MGRSRILLAALAAVLVCAGAVEAANRLRADGPTTQEVTVTASDGTQLACGLVLPGGSTPSGGWPAVILFHGLGLTHSEMETLAQASFQPAGLAALACDARGTGASQGTFGLDGPAETQDARDLFAWLAARPDVSDTQIGAYGVSLGGSAVWNAAAAGVPFKAIVADASWTSLDRALVPDGVLKSQLLTILQQVVPLSRWDPALAQLRSDLLHGQTTDADVQVLAARSSRARLSSLTVPTLIVQSRHDFLFDLDQATAAYRLLAGPKRLYVGDPGHAMSEVVAWFEAYLADGRPPAGGVELAHAPWDGTTTTYPGLPPERGVSVNLAGTTTLTNGKSSLLRSVRLPGGPLETFGDGSVSVRYSSAAAWTQLVATVYAKGMSEPVTEGAGPIAASSGVVKIPLLNTAVLLPRGKPLTVRIGETSQQGVFNGATPAAGRTITIGRVTLHLSLLRLAVSR